VLRNILKKLIDANKTWHEKYPENLTRLLSPVYSTGLTGSPIIPYKNTEGHSIH
jgi:hypothetical protein